MSKKKSFKKDEIQQLVKLANLTLNEEELKKFEKQLNEILSYIEQLKEIDTKATNTTTNISGLRNINFKDGLGNDRLLNSNEFQQNSKNKKDSYFKVPKIL